MQVKFYTRNVAKEKEKPQDESKLQVKVNGQTQPVWAYLTYHGQRLRISTKINVSPDEWNANKQKIRGEGIEVADYNERLFNIKEEAYKIYRDSLKNNKRLTTDALRHKLLPIIFPDKYVKPSENENLLTFLQDYIEHNPKNIKKGTMKAYMQLVPIFQDLMKRRGKSFIEFDSIDLTWSEYFTSYLYKSRNHSMNTVAKHIKNVKALMKRALLKEKHSNIKFMNMTKNWKDSDAIYLNEDELKSIYALKLSPELEDSRNILIFSCLTGLRFSDVSNLKKHHWKGNCIEIRTVKTEDPLRIPLRKTAVDILERYEGTFPEMHLPKYNKQIKEIGSMIDSLKTEEGTFHNKGGEKQEFVRKKFEMIQSHTGRRSFATNEYLNGTDLTLIRAVTGHKTEKDFFRYIKVKQKQNADKLGKIFDKRKF
ncbi:MAG: site-specific integrase [Bacteroidia bacterium]|nr:site-specific integrase [Bacteroidia bacterium]